MVRIMVVRCVDERLTLVVIAVTLSFPSRLDPWNCQLYEQRRERGGERVEGSHTHTHTHTLVVVKGVLKVPCLVL